MIKNSFNYNEFIHRNIGFVSDEEQLQLKETVVFVCGVGGMGGACLQSLVRMGIQNFIIADFDVFEMSNLNRQVFANLYTINKEKTQATKDALLAINPCLTIQIYGEEWINRLDEILSKKPIIINGMDDIKSGILLYRKAQIHGCTVIDAYTSPLPSVTVVKPESPRPELRFNYPTVHKAWEEITDKDIHDCLLLELEYTLIHSNPLSYIELKYAKELILGKRKRMSFAPMVILTGNLMAYETLKLKIQPDKTTSYKGYFFDVLNMKILHPKNKLTAWILQKMVRKFMRKLFNE